MGGKSSHIEQELTRIRKELHHVRVGQDMLLARERILKQEEDKVLSSEHAELSELERLEELEQNIANDVKDKPLARITKNDFTRAIIGAIIGVVGHFAFFYGTEIAELANFTMGRALSLYVTSLLVVIVFLYFTGFRKVDRDSLKYMPTRVAVIYLASLLVSVFVLFLFGFIHFEAAQVPHIIKSVASVSLLAALGAATADLIGRD